ncbi:pentatricopeptide repeat-containing protein At4g02750-like [Punica granatum]|uniref:Pentatricopeptide repeat-containing protein At4g02750-like n=1 Tax=Punica granatum TaxID=22663 RepID=A0A6P8D653_PUNGR|nr:pentatricopeptide repeat-containing protein At4g02750-like [Punica granatum]
MEYPSSFLVNNIVTVVMHRFRSLRCLHQFKNLPAKNRSTLDRHVPITKTRRIPVADNVITPQIPSDSETREFNIRIGRLGCHGRVEEARNLFNEMPRRDAVSYATMITTYLKNNNLEKAESLFYAMSGSNIVAESAMISGYIHAGRLRDARKVFDEMRERNVYSWTSMVSGYFRSSNADEARRLFDQMPVKNDVSWTTVIVGYARNGLIDQAREVFDAMPEKNVIAWTAIIKSYIECDHLNEAEKLFKKMPQKNLYTWNIMIAGLMQDARRVDEATHLFNSVPQKNEVSWTTMVTGLARNGMTERARDYFDQMPNKDIAAYNAMITRYIDQGLVMEAKELFNSMPERNLVTWNAMLDGLGRSGPTGEALELLNTMLYLGFVLNETTLTSALTSCRGLPEVMQVHAMVIPRGFDQDVSLTNALIAKYSHSGDLQSARVAFEDLKARDVVSWTSMILAYSNHGCGLHALQAFARMLRAGENPDRITFVGILSACSHAGLVRKGRMLFDSMKIAYGLEPTAEHYSCLVDILGRAGKVDEAIKVVSQMPWSQRDEAVLGALLGACRLHGDGDDRVVNYIGESLIEMEPSMAGSYVLLGNVYAASGKWDELARVRKKMKERNVKKVPGFSQIEVKCENSVFYAGDQAHPDMEEIYRMLRERLVPVMCHRG